jgi:hypothetical protein
VNRVFEVQNTGRADKEVIMTNLETVHNTSSNQVPAADGRSHLAQALRGRLTKALDTAQKLHGDAEWLAIETEDLWADLKKIADSDVVDSATWLHNATANAQDEFSVLIDRLFDAIESLNTDTD